MATATQERVIDGMTFRVTQLPAMRGVKMLNRLVRILGPAAGRAFAGADPSAGLGGLDVGALGGAVAALTERLSDDELESIIRTLLETATVDNTPLLPVFDLKLQGRMGSLLKLLGFALEVNYSNFTSVLAASVPQGLRTQLNSAGSSISGKSGPAGDSSSSA
jgi:hypothetical protein